MKGEIYISGKIYPFVPKKKESQEKLSKQDPHIIYKEFLELELDKADILFWNDLVDYCLLKNSPEEDSPGELRLFHKAMNNLLIGWNQKLSIAIKYWSGHSPDHNFTLNLNYIDTINLSASLKRFSSVYEDELLIEKYLTRLTHCIGGEKGIAHIEKFIRNHVQYQCSFANN